MIVTYHVRRRPIGADVFALDVRRARPLLAGAADADRIANGAAVAGEIIQAAARWCARGSCRARSVLSPIRFQPAPAPHAARVGTRQRLPPTWRQRGIYLAS